MSEQTATATANVAAQQTEQPTAKPPRFSVPFGNPIFSVPDRHIMMERKDKHGKPTGSKSYLVADVLLPMPGGVLTARTSIWREERFDRENNQFVDVFSCSLSRNAFNVADGRQEVYNDWRHHLLTLYDKWAEALTDADKTKRPNGPRLVKTRPGPIVASPDQSTASK